MKSKVTRVVLSLLVVLGICLIATLPAFANGNGGKPGQEKVCIMHRTGSESNPYVIIWVSPKAVPAHLAHGDLLCDDCNGTEQPDPGANPIR